MCSLWRTTLLAMLLLAGPALAGSAEPVRIGAFLAVTGPAAYLGDPELKTLQMAVADLNANGGLLGRPVELVHYDTGGNAREAVDFAKRLIKNDRVDIIVGGSTSSDTLAVIPEVEKEGVPLLALSGAVDIVEPVKKWVFKVAPSDRMAVIKIYQDLRKRNLSKIALITGDGGFDKSGREQLRKLAGEYGMVIVADEAYSNKDTDMSAPLNKIRATDAQAIINFGFGQAPAIVTKNIKQLGITLPVYQSHGVASQTFIDLAGDAAEGVRLPASPLLVAEQLADADPQKPVLLAYKRQYQARYGAASAFGGYAYDGAMIAMAAIQRAGSVNKAAVRDEIERTAGFIGTAGVFNITPEDHMGLALDALKLVEIRKGGWTLIK